MRSAIMHSKGRINGGLVMKRGRGRPRKIHSHDLADPVETAENLPEFFKIYMAALSSNLLRIPPDFMDKFGGNIPTRCTIENPRGGLSWQVEMKKVDDCWFFQKGWPNFVQQNSLGDGDFLTFSYVAQSLFYVNIFSPNGCAKNTTTTRIHHQSENCEINETSFPSFSVVIMKTHFNKGVLNLPFKFWKEHMKKIKRSRYEVTFWVENQAWNVRLVIYNADRAVFQKGCSKFIRDNSLQLGTSCTFQLIHTNPLSFNVTFHRPDEEV